MARDEERGTGSSPPPKVVLRTRLRHDLGLRGGLTTRDGCREGLRAALPKHSSNRRVGATPLRLLDSYFPNFSILEK